MRLPTANRLLNLGIDLPTAKRVRKALEEAFSESDVSTDIRITTALDAADAILQEAGKSHGVEYIAHSDDSMHEVWGIEYVNMGDPYRTTLLFDNMRHGFDVCPWGNIIESAPEGSYP